MKTLLLLATMLVISYGFNPPTGCMQPPIPDAPEGCTINDAVLQCYPGCECTWYFENC